MEAEIENLKLSIHDINLAIRGDDATGLIGVKGQLMELTSTVKELEKTLRMFVVDRKVILKMLAIAGAILTGLGAIGKFLWECWKVFHAHP